MYLKTISRKRQFSSFWGTIWDNFWYLLDHFGGPRAVPGRLWAGSETGVEILTILIDFGVPFGVTFWLNFVTFRQKVNLGGDF